jgi:sulfatase modifying factor 1
MKRFVTSLILLLSLTFSSALRANASSQWMWHGAFPWVYSHAESSWWYMKAGTDGKFLAWKQGDEKWYSFDEASKAWVVLPGQEEEENKAGDTYTVPDLSLEMLWVEPGTFTMGNPSRLFPGNETQHQVTLSNGFWLGKYEVTQAQWEKVMGSNPSYFKGANRPVEEVSWNDVTSFCDKLTELERQAGRLPAGMAYQLPTEAQWEYACRAGTETAYAFGDLSFLVSGQTNINGGPGKTTDVGSYPANGWGFYDMHGNVREWCADWYEGFTSRAVSDPVGPAVGSYRVLRGGSWHSSANGARSASRSRVGPAGSYSVGFRLSLRPVHGQDEQQVPTANKAGDTYTVPDLSLEMLWVEPGTFTMGSPSSENDRVDDETQHTVTLTEGYWLGKYEVTQAQWEKVMGDNPSYFKGADRPVETVSWAEATYFCEKLTEQESRRAVCLQG